MYNTVQSSARRQKGPMFFDSSTSKTLSIEMESQLERQKKEEMILLGFNLSNVSRSTQFILLTVATFFFYLIYGYMQELIFRLEGFRPFGWYLTLVQFACYTVFGVTELHFKEDRTRKIPLKSYGVLAFLTVATMGLSNTSVGYLNYPTQVIFKCCKLIPVLIGGILIQGKKFSMIDIAACVCMSLGLILFTLADSTVSPNFNLYGVILILLALCADGAIGNVQEKTLKQFGATNSEMVLYSYGIGFLYILVGMFVMGDIVSAFQFCRDHVVETYGYAVIFSITGYIGVNIVLTLVKTFGALVAVTVTTCRKAVTIILSFMFFAKPFTLQYLWSALVVVLGIYLNLYSKNKADWDNKMKNLLARTRFKPKILSPENIV
ncbi:adenosine 3'-phospho 5'-phosphosulfate transporter 2-like isoform X1 [Gigantopelta aegis]|uniref:adenosine 3'-phospho 5'-phosphosulfate transporter 2-like isoform X1 n=1 Tax=Gigantopelta aegis TaxID=1735272 RepID=UPI001B888DFB|nr:adenosine 3'-phospho 5'-phosphosulfate transporter 2-like isoform X1 [Gigantopelta aegis]XP_041358038.1 adenosine 3'-phospho 5'-phosphosulfate transporter 2-like isoform X1 [Gigantopelta aegis]XP_041358039.1 adenosine 3'-phospho 5'-phosphosulfate transporter 2-like isoform X1 [Gigantopelta aegis]XP_041358040.1 adenosine 3'-phospho 5'-phosphosulfate transporter 2-like isoform X1 [Gigantopelta aegis]